MANTTWNPSDKSANVTLTGSNLIATASSPTGWVRAIDKQASGKYYWEVTATTFTQTSSAVGLAGIIADLTQNISNPASSFKTCGVIRSGVFFVEGNSTGISFGAIVSGTVICIAVDLSARLMWIRLGAAGNWNNSASANPATATGGVSIYLGGGIAAYPFFIPNLASEQAAANFGDTAFAGAVPSGFTSGFTAGAVIPTNELLTQAALEQWGSGTPVMQMTQAAVEMWGNTQVVNPLMIATQLAVEMWAPVASASITPVQARAMILA